MSNPSSTLRLLAALLAVGMAGQQAFAFEADTVTIKVGFGAGGGYDAAARLVGQHIGRFLPGDPNTVVQNVTGGGSMRLTQMMLGSEPPDGSVIATVSSSMAFAPVLEPETADFDPHALQWIGALAMDPSFCVVMKDSGIDTMEAFLSEDFLVGASGRSSLTYLLAAIVKNGLGAEFGIVTGFEGGPDIVLAMQRGEIAGRCGISPFNILESNLEASVAVLGRFGSAVPEDYADLPRFSALIEDPVVRRAAEVIEVSRDTHLPFLAPAGTPPEILAALREAFAAMAADPEFLADAERRGLEIHFTSGEDMEAMLDQLLASDPAVFDAARDLVR